jgi:acid phosphatase
MRRRAAVVVCLAIWCAGCAGRQSATIAGPPPPPPPANPQQTALFADLWVQASAEYRALCLQIYRNAEAVVLERAAAVGSGGKPAAVALDLDETVIDNSGFQTWLYRNNTTYSGASWAKWTEWQAAGGRARAVPGAAEFLAALEGAGVAAVYISNRREGERRATVAVLEELGLETGDPGERLLLRTAESGKEARRDQLRTRWNVIAFVGDNLADFAPEFEVSGKNWRDRLAAVEAAKAKWGVEWFVLPNPAYGDWVLALPEPLDGQLDGPTELSAPESLQSQ